MKLATSVIDGRRRVLKELNGGWVDLTASPLFDGIEDVGSLLRSRDGALDAARSVTSGPVIDTAKLEFQPPITAPGKILCVGLNYAAHAAESGDAIPSRPIIFAKFANTLVGSTASIVKPHVTEQLDYEAELAIVIGKRARGVTAGSALQYVAGLMAANDVSARDLQSEDPAGQWVRGKTLDTFCPVGPHLTTLDEVGPWREIRVQAWVNGELRQDELCGDMIFGIEQLVEFISDGITLEPGDMILTGTPAGVGIGFNPPKYIVPGDVVRIAMTGLGAIESKVVAE